MTARRLQTRALGTQDPHGQLTRVQPDFPAGRQRQSRERRTIPNPELVANLARQFLAFGEGDAYDRSPLYRSLCAAIADDPEILEIATHARAGQQVPNLFLAVVHFLLLKGEDSPIAAYYRSLRPDALPPDSNTYPLFRRFCLEHRPEIESLVAERLVQTNEPKRSAALVLGLNEVAGVIPNHRLALVEVGASAGLNLLYERFTYDFGRGRTAAEGSPIVIPTDLSGAYGRPIHIQKIGSKIGIDLNPIPADDPDACAWLRALIWPEHEERRRLQDAVLEIARANPPQVIAGDAIELLPAVAGSLPPEAAICVFHSATLAHFGNEARARFVASMETLAEHRETAWLSLEGPGIVDGPLRNASPAAGMVMGRLAHLHRAFHVLGLTVFPWGERRERHDRLLAAVDGHGSWIEWLGRE